MKTHFLKLMAFVLILIPILSSCEKELVCGVKNPVKDLPWLKETVHGIKRDILAGFSHHVKIYQCTYRDGDGFLLDMCVKCPDAGYLLTNCEGENLCVMWGETGDPCTEYKVDFDNKQLIWKIYR
jgi:hypothetical protein